MAAVFLTGGKPLTPLLIILTVDIKPQNILLEEVKNVNSSRQIEFTGVPFVILWAVKWWHWSYIIKKEKEAGAKKSYEGNWLYNCIA